MEDLEYAQQDGNESFDFLDDEQTLTQGELDELKANGKFLEKTGKAIIKSMPDLIGKHKTK